MTTTSTDVPSADAVHAAAGALAVRAARVPEPPMHWVRRRADRVVAALDGAEHDGARDAWLATAAECQGLINTLSAVQDAALAEVARRENVWCEDGTLGETVHGHGRVSLDAADVAAAVLGASHAQAQRRVEQAVRLAAGRVPLEADNRHAPEASGLGGLHEAMAAGRLDGYRAGVVAHELETAPAEVADTVVAVVTEHLGDDGPALRRRVRRLLARISPDLLRQRAERARAATGLRRWVAEPGVDEWHGTFPSEDAAAAWAAIDRLAHDLVADGTCSSVEQARGRALTDLVTGNASVEVQVVLTVPADVATAQAHGGTTDAGLTNAGTTDAGTTDAGPSQVDTTGDTLCGDTPARHADSADDLVEVQGLRPSEPLLVPRAWLRDHLAPAPSMRRRRGETRRVTPKFVPCDPLTGARLDPDDALATLAYRPSPQLVALVRARDGRCRFPGCSVAAGFCDLDHVRPWPIGRTSARNLLSLCRRHHRVKQRPGWRVRLARDGTATWTGPTGRVRTTAPLDALQALVLADTTGSGGDGTAAASVGTDDHGPRWASSPEHDAAPAPGAAAASGDARPPSPSRWSALETHVALLLEHRPAHRRCTSGAQLLTASTRSRRRAPVHDPPPF